MHTVYVLRSLKDGKLYTGSTGDLERRLKEHNAGKTASTKWRRPFVVIYKEEFQSRQEAESRERYLKTGKGRGELKKMIEALAPVSDVTNPPHGPPKSRP